jgi:hypothetical protein
MTLGAGSNPGCGFFGNLSAGELFGTIANLLCGAKPKLAVTG